MIAHKSVTNPHLILELRLSFTFLVFNDADFNQSNFWRRCVDLDFPLVFAIDLDSSVEVSQIHEMS